MLLEGIVVQLSQGEIKVVVDPQACRAAKEGEVRYSTEHRPVRASKCLEETRKGPGEAGKHGGRGEAHGVE